MGNENLRWLKVEVSRPDRELEPVLIELGHVTVFCGKNNSGKTTILDGIGRSAKQDGGYASRNRDESRRVFIEAIKVAADRIDHRVKAIWNPREIADGLLIGFQSVYNHSSMKTWETNVVKWVRSWLQNHSIVSSQLHESTSRVIVEEIIKKNIVPSIQLLVDNRDMPLKDTPSGKLEPIDRNGKNVVNNLFAAKNAVPNKSSDALDSLFFTKVQETFKSLTDGISFDVYLNNELRFMLQNESHHLEPGSCGKGLRELLHLAYRVHEPGVDILIVDEPELHLHFGAQQRLIKTIAEQKNKQFVLASHSGAFTDPRYVDQLYVVEFKDGIKVNPAQDRANALYSLGHCPLDDLTADLILLVEGSNDVHIYRSLLGQLGVDPQYNVRYWNMQGSAMKHLDLELFADTYNMAVLLDKDPKEDREEFVGRVEQLSIPVYRLKRYAIENYIPLEIYKNHYPSLRDSEKISEIDPDVKVEEQFSFDPKKKTYAIARDLRVEHIRETDLFEILQKIRENIVET